MKTGIQVSSLKPLLLNTQQVQTAFEHMAALGCGNVQLQWIDPNVPIGDIAETVNRWGMKSTGIQDFYETVVGNLGYYANLNAATGGQWFTVSRIPERCKSREGLDVFAQELRALQRKLNPLGQIICLHPVSADFAAVPGFDAVGYLLEQLPDMQLCLDLYHLDRSCTDMPGFIRRYTGRIPMVHFKDADAEGKLVSAGSGIVNWQGVVAACLDAGVQYGLVEQEKWEEDPYICLGRALTWLHGELEKA